MKKYMKNVLFILSIIALFVALNVLDMPNSVFSYTYALAEKYVFTTKDAVPTFTVGTPVLVPGTKSDGTKYDQMYINKLGEIRVPITAITNVTSKDDFTVKVTRNGTDVTSNFVITKTAITNKAMTITLAMKEGGTYVASSYVITVSVNHEWEEEVDTSETTTSRVKIIRNESIGTLAWGASTNNWNSSSLQAILIGRYYNATGAYDSIGLTDEARELISEVEWKLGGYTAGSGTSSTLYTAERGSTTYGSNPTTWTGNVGLMYPSDYGFAAGSSCWSTSLTSYSTNCKGTDWLYSNANQSTITHALGSSTNIFYISNTGILASGGVTTTYATRPVVYLDADVVVTGGTGTQSNPYTIKKSSSTTNNLVQKLKTLSSSELVTDGTTDNNIRYVGSNPSNYITFNGETWRIIGVMNNVKGNDNGSLEAKSNTISKTTSFSLVDKYYNFEGSIRTVTNYPNNPSNKANEWQVTLNEFEEIDTSKLTYKLTNASGTNYTTSLNFSIKKTTNGTTSIVYSISNSKYFRPKAGTYTFTVTYSNTSVSNSRGTLTKTFTFVIGGRETTFTEEYPVESYRYIRTASSKLVSIQVTNITDSSVTFREDATTYTMTMEDFNKTYPGSSVQDIGHTEDGDVFFSFEQDEKTYFVYRVTNTTVYYINLASEETDSNGNIITRFNMSKEDFETSFPNQLDALNASTYSIDNTGDVYCSINVNKAITILTTETTNRTINAGGGGVFYFKYKYSGFEADDFNNNLTYKIFTSAGKEVTTKNGFSVKDMKVTATDDENGHFIFTLDYNNTDESYVGEYYIRFYINDGNETITKDVGFSLYEGEIGYYVNHTSTAISKNSNKQYDHYIGFYLRKGNVLATSINPHGISVEIYDSFADIDENGNVFFYDLVDYELQFVNKKDNRITYRVFEAGEEISGSPFTTTVEEFKNSKYSQAAELLDNYKFDSTTGNLITDSTNYKEDNNTLIDIISTYYSEEKQQQLLVYKVNGTQKEDTYEQIKASYPDIYYYLDTNFSFDEDGNIIVGRIRGSHRENEKTKVGNNVTDQFVISINEEGNDLEKAIVVVPKTEVNPQSYYVYVSYENLPGLGFVNNDPDTLITKYEFPEQWNQNSHMTLMTFDDPEYGIELSEPTLSNEGDDTDNIYDNIEGTATFDLTISDTFKFENKYTYAIFYSDPDNEKFTSTGDIDWGEPIQTSTSTNKMFDVTSDLFSMKDRESLIPYETTLTLSTIKGVAHQKGNYKIVLYYSNNGVTNTGEQTFKIDGKYYGLVLDEEKTDELSYIRNFSETKTIVFDGYYISNYDNINITMIQENSSGDLEIKRTATNTTSGKFSYDGEDEFTYKIEKEQIDDSHSVYTFKMTNITDVPFSAQYHLYFTYKEDGGDEVTTVVDFIVNPATYIWEIAEEDVPAAEGNTLYFTKEITTAYIEDLNQFVFTVMKWNGTSYVDVSSDEATKKEFESVEFIDKECSGLECSGNLKITLKDDTDRTADYYLYSQYLKEDDETDIGDLEAMFNWDIANVKISGSYYDPVENKDYIVDGFFKNVEDTTIDITLDTLRTDAIHWELNRVCLSSGYACEVNNSNTITYNSFLTEVSNGNKKLKLRVNYDYLNENDLKVQQYSLVLYYNESDLRVYTLEVHGNYVLVKFGNSLVYSTTIGAEGTKNVDGLFKNKNGFIYVPVTIVGVSYDDPGVNVTLKNANGTTDYLGRPFEFIREDFNSSHAIDIKYLASSESIAISQDYTLAVEYNNGEEIFRDELNFRLNEKYFNYDIGAPSYNPDPLLPNNDGKITFRITTEDIPNVQFGTGNIESLSEKYTMMNNAVILNNKGENVTSKFTKSVVNGDSNNNFDLTLAFKAGTMDPGDYTLRMVYELEGYELTKEKSFSIGNYAKELEVTSVEIISTTTDNRMHNNVDGTYRLHYESAYNINPGFIEVNIFNGEKNITDKFTVLVQDKYIDIKYLASTNLAEGDFNVVITYQDDEMVEGATTVTQAIKLYGAYKQIDLSNLNSSSQNILADIENQYYTFEVNEQPIADDLDNLKWIITDEDGEDVTSHFKVTNNLKSDDDNFKVEIIPFASPIGKYHVRLYLLPDGEDEDIEEERMYSNTIDITIDDTYYKINMNNTSTLTQLTNYSSTDKTSIYDRDGAKGNYLFTSTYSIDDLSIYTIAITDSNGKIIKELDNAIVNNNGVLSVAFNTGAITDIGDYKVMVCINHLPYSGLNMKVVKFIPVTKVTMRINSVSVGTSYSAYSNTTYSASYIVEPTNATNQNFTFKSSNTTVATISGTNIVTKNGGTSTITLTNGDITVTATLNVNDRISSKVYTIDHTAKTIFVSTMTKTQLTKTEFMGNITGYTSYQILDSSNRDITSTTTLVGTSMGLKVSGITYKIIVIGDVTGDGKINTGDVSQLFQHIRKKNVMTDPYKLKAGAVRRQSTTNTGDVTKLFQFIRGKTSSL